MDLLTIGSIALDTVFVVTHIPTGHFGARIKHFGTYFGGRAPNVAAIAAKLGTKSGIYSLVGDDFESSGYRSHLDKLGVDLSGVTRIQGKKTVQIFIFVDENNNQITFAYSDLLDHWKDLQVPVELIRQTRLVHFTTGGNYLLNVDCAKNATELGCAVSFDLGNDPVLEKTDYIRSMLPHVKYLFMNDLEAKKHVDRLGLKDPEDILNFGPQVVTTISISPETHTHIFTREGKIAVAHPIGSGEILIGASDAFVAGFLVGLSNGYELTECGRLGSVVSSFIRGAKGVQSKMPSWSQVSERYLKTFGSRI